LASNRYMLFLKLFGESFLFAFDALRQNKLRTILSLLGVTIGIFTIIAVFSAVDTLRNNLQGSINKLGSNSIYIQKWPWVFDGDFPWWKFIQRPVPNLRDYELLKERSQTADGVCYSIYIDNRNLKYQDNVVQGVTLRAATHDFYKTRLFDIEDGRYFTESESRSGAPVVLVGHDVADGLFPNKSAVGQRIKVMGRYVIVVGVFAKEGESMIGMTTDQQVMMPINFARDLIDIQSDKYNSQIVVKGKPGISEADVESELKGLMRSIRRLSPGQEDTFSLNKATLLTNALDQLFGIVNIAGMIIGGFSILVGGFGIANIMFVSVKERTNIIGIQKSLGAKNYFIMLQFLIEAVLLCLMGGVIGLAAVYGGTYIVKALADVKIVLDVNNVIIGIGTSVTIGVISGIVPAFFAARLDPVEAIRTN
jgi:putative ABC transport system permease protein